MLRPRDNPTMPRGVRSQSPSTLNLDTDLNTANGALEGLCFSPAGDFFGPAEIFITASDNGVVKNGDSLTANSTISLIVIPVNDPPVVVAPRVHRRSDGLGPMAIEGIIVDDVDTTEGEIIIVNASVDTGSLVMEESPTVSTVVLHEDAPGTPRGFTVSGLLDDVGQALSKVWFVPPSDGWEGGGVVRISASDMQGAVGEVECVVVVSDPNVEPNVTVTNVSFIADQGKAASLRGVHLEDAVVDAAVFAGTTPPMFHVHVVVTAGGIGLTPVPLGLSPIAETDTAVAAMAAISAGTGLEGMFGTPRPSLSFRGTLEGINEAFDALTYSSANGSTGLGNQSVILNVTRRGKTHNYSGLRELVVNVRPVNQAPIVSWTVATPPVEVLELEGIPLAGLHVEDTDLPEGETLSVRMEMLNDKDTLVALSGADAVEFTVGSARGEASSVVAFRGNISSINNLFSSSAGFLAAPASVGILRVQVEDNDGGETSLEVEIYGTHVNSAPEVTVTNDVNMTLKEGGVLERIGELAGLNVADSDVEDSTSGYLTMTVGVSHRSVLEMQRVTTSATRIDPVQSITTFAAADGNSTVQGTFNLTLDFSELCDECKVENTGPIWYDAICNEGDRYLGVETGGEAGESIQAKLENLPSMKFLGVTVFCKVDGDLTSTRGRKWLVTFLGAPNTLPVMQASGESLTGDGVGIKTASVVAGNALSGSFTLSLGGYTTQRIPFNAVSHDVATALETLPSIDAVDVTMPSSPDPQGGQQWDITLFSVFGSGGDMPLMEADGSTLGGRGAAVSVDETVPGRGIPELWEVSTSAAHRNMVVVVAMSGASRAKGYFQLGLDYGGTNAWTRPIYPRAVGPISDEAGSWWSFGGVPGERRGESVEARLKLLDNWTELGPDADVLVERIESADKDTLEWHITFTGAPEDLPVLSVHGAHLSGGAVISATVTTTHNAVKGSFFLQYGGVSTSALAHDSTGAEVATALNALETFFSSDIGTGVAVATRAQKISAEGGRRWTIALLRDSETPANLTATGSLATGLMGASARASARLIRPGGRGAVLRLVDLGGAAFGIPGYTIGETLTIHGSPDKVTNALASLSYSPIPGWSGGIDIIFRVTDGGFTGAGGVKTGWAMLSAAVESVNDPPYLLWCGGILPSTGRIIKGVDEDAPFRLADYDCHDGGIPEPPAHFDHVDLRGPGSGLRVHDPDHGATKVQVKTGNDPFRKMDLRLWQWGCMLPRSFTETHTTCSLLSGSLSEKQRFLDASEYHERVLLR